MYQLPFNWEASCFASFNSFKRILENIRKLVTKKKLSFRLPTRNVISVRRNFFLILFWLSYFQSKPVPIMTFEDNILKRYFKYLQRLPIISQNPKITKKKHLTNLHVSTSIQYKVFSFSTIRNYQNAGDRDFSVLDYKPAILISVNQNK